MCWFSLTCKVTSTLMQSLQADMDDKESLEKAVAGSYAVFAMTNCMIASLTILISDCITERLLCSLGSLRRSPRDCSRQGYCKCCRRCRREATHLVIAP